MTILDGIVLGALQGITEFIPVSSSGHLVIAQHFLGLQVSPVFDSLINLGTFLALLVYFRKKLWDIAKQIVSGRDYRLARNILISAIPVGVAGYFLKHFFESSTIQSPWVVVVTLALVGTVMVTLEKLPRASTVSGGETLTPKRAGFIGLAQMMALIPGVSRSGSSIIAARIAGLTYAKAAEYSFLLSIPVMFAVVVMGFVGSDGREFIHANFALWATSNVVAFVCGIVAVGFMLKFLAKGNLGVFGWYRLSLAGIVAALLLIG